MGSLPLWKGATMRTRRIQFNVCASLPHLAGTVKSNHGIRGSARVPAWWYQEYHQCIKLLFIA